MEEPIFTLRAQDIHAPAIILAWVDKMVQNPGITEAQFNKATAAFKVALDMVEWQKANPDKVKIPDLEQRNQAKEAA